MFYIVILVGHLLIVPFQGDDTYYATVSDHYSLHEWLTSRYLTWSGRLFPDAMSYILLDEKVWLWRILNSLIILLLSYSIVRIIKKEITLKDILIAVITLGYIHQGVLSSGFFWITGSLNYLWPIAFGLFAMIPFSDRIFRNNETTQSSVVSIAFLLVGFIATISNEQVALCLSCFGIIANAYLYLKNKKIDSMLLITTIFFIFGTFILLLAPGNSVRFDKEIITWYPEFESLSAIKHIYIGTVWLFEKMFNELRALILVLSVIYTIVCLKEKDINKNKILIIFVGLIVVFLSFTFLGNDEMKYLFDFKRILNLEMSVHLFSLLNIKNLLLSLFPFIFWTLYCLLLFSLIIKKSGYKYFVLFCLLAALSTLALMFFSPTIYASGRRVLCAASVLFSVIIFCTIAKHRIFTNTYVILIFSIFPLINLMETVLKWFFRGFSPFL
jgi:hypothetical protein